MERRKSKGKKKAKKGAKRRKEDEGNEVSQSERVKEIHKQRRKET